MYEGLYDMRKGMSEEDANIVGAMTARLLRSWDRWAHRRVERVTFCDEDALLRSVSMDFTVPAWFHELRETPKESSARQLVPLGFLRKGALINFSLQDEAGSSLPLLSAPQNAQVASAALRVVAQEALKDQVPDRIKCDIQDLVQDSPVAARQAFARLFATRDAAWEARQALAKHARFVGLAKIFTWSFLVLTMIQIERHERRILHFSYEEPRSDPTRARRFFRQFFGKARVLAVAVSSLTEAASYHLEVEAPPGLMISRRERFFFETPDTVEWDAQGGSFRRAHFHFAGVPPRSSATVALHLRPRRSSVVRLATLMTLLAFVAALATTVRFSHIENGDNAAAAGLLLVSVGIVGVALARSGETEMATNLLFPLRVLAMAPVVLAVAAATVVVWDPEESIGHFILGSLSAAMGVCLLLLLVHWFAISRSIKQEAGAPQTLSETLEI